MSERPLPLHCTLWSCPAHPCQSTHSLLPCSPWTKPELNLLSLAYKYHLLVSCRVSYYWMLQFLLIAIILGPIPSSGFKFSWFFKNFVTYTSWHRSDSLNPHAIRLIIIVSCVALRYVLGLISRVGFTCLIWFGVHRNRTWLIKSCVASSSIEYSFIRPIPLSMFPVFKPRKCSAVMVRVSLSSMHLVLTKRAMYDYLMVVVLKKVDAMSISLQSSTLRCLVDWVLFVEFSVVGCAMVIRPKFTVFRTSSRIPTLAPYLSWRSLQTSFVALLILSCS